MQARYICVFDPEYSTSIVLRPNIMNPQKIDLRASVVQISPIEY